MKENAKQILYLFCGLSLLLLPVETFNFVQSNTSALVTQSKTLDLILKKREAYKNLEQGRGINKLVNILIVPGHDDEVYGAEYKNLKEVELNRELSKKIQEYLLKEGGINPVLASDENGYNLIFENYFKRERASIEEFIKNSKEIFALKIHGTDFDAGDFHNPAVQSVVYKLYGINRWINVQDFDLVIHVHFNDYPGRGRNNIGKHSGFSIYAPGENFSNYQLSRDFAEVVFEELQKVQTVSTLKSESEGIIETHELIALGANESLEAGSILIEYGYIYESNFVDEEKRKITFDYFAYATYSAIKKLLNETPQEKIFTSTTISKNKTTLDNLEWQFQKALQGKYPPEGKTLQNCPITGYFGSCSLEAK